VLSASARALSEEGEVDQDLEKPETGKRFLRRPVRPLEPESVEADLVGAAAEAELEAAVELGLTELDLVDLTEVVDSAAAAELLVKSASVVTAALLVNTASEVGMALAVKTASEVRVTWTWLSMDEGAAVGTTAAEEALGWHCLAARRWTCLIGWATMREM
jgi:hypothetical protein